VPLPSVVNSSPAHKNEPLTWGIWLPDVTDDPAKIDRFAAQVGSSPGIVMWYLSWSDGGDFDRSFAEAVTARGATPLVTWEPWDWTQGMYQPRYANARVAAGDFDPMLRRWARDVGAWGGPLYIRFAHEMNGDWYPWSPGHNGNTAASYVAMWRHVVDVFRQEGASNVRWVWSPNANHEGAVPFEPLYPGDSYVDWAALDGFNYGPTRSWSGWRELRTVFGASYDALTRLTDKPVMLAEVGSTEEGGDKAKWITRGLLSDIPEHFPNIRAVIWFNERKPEDPDWRIDTSPTALDAFRRVASSSRYQGHLP
jgi:beta-mannanase